MINYTKHYTDNADIFKITEVIKNKNLTQGENIKKFENELNKYFKSPYSTVVTNGSIALQILGRILNWTKKDVVITTPLTFVATSNAILHANARIEFIDINEFQTIDCIKLEKKIIQLRKKNIKVNSVIAVDYAGGVCDWKKLNYLKKKYNFYLINDNCHAMGTHYEGTTGYAIKYADFVTLSFHPAKNFTSAEGGAILSKKKIYKSNADLLRNQGIKKSKKAPWLYDVTKLSSNFRISDLHCALGISQIKKLNKFVLKRRKLAKIYDNIFLKSNNFIIPKYVKGCRHSYHLYPLQIAFQKLKISKLDLYNYLVKRKISFQVHYVPIYKFSIYKKKLNLKKINTFKNTENFYKKSLSIPIFFSLSLSKAKNIGQIIFNFVEKNKK